MEQSKRNFITLQQAQNVAGDLKQSDLVRKKIDKSKDVTPAIAVSEIGIDGDLYFKIITSYYYINEESQLLVAETKDHNNNTVEFTEKLWEYDESKDKFTHKKYFNGKLTVERDEDNGYGKPEDIAEFENVQTLGIGDLHTCTASGSCCQFEAQTYNHCGANCGDHESAGGGGHINNCDACCETHDDCLQGRDNDDRCYCDENLNYCYSINSCPGDSIMGAGIRAAAAVAACDYEQYW
ncbi:hypothetical protein [Salinicoccus carnicancri]|uniref:hypothetical protein n=1 Tax=Salinicoccus carnicancri TaxID=558170 RepID=UPI0002F6B0B5|nr:hypothetical protein [Salinicoccus carnicancri]